MIARCGASLDLLSGGRVELGVGVCGFWDAIQDMSGRRLTPGQSVGALEEAIQIIRKIGATDKPGGVRINGTYYQVKGTKGGPKPAHDIRIWVGAYKPRMLELTGRVADGWLPSLAYLPGGRADLEEMNKHFDEGVALAGRNPSKVRRLLNISGQYARAGRSLLNGPPQQWAEDIASIALTYGISGFILAADSSLPLMTRNQSNFSQPKSLPLRGNSLQRNVHDDNRVNPTLTRLYLSRCLMTLLMTLSWRTLTILELSEKVWSAGSVVERCNVW